ncbi:hypothetical protein ACFL56_01805 [Candidatus Margulisiibacteriota bacterium]
MLQRKVIYDNTNVIPEKLYLKPEDIAKDFQIQINELEDLKTSYSHENQVAMKTYIMYIDRINKQLSMNKLMLLGVIDGLKKDLEKFEKIKNNLEKIETINYFKRDMVALTYLENHNVRLVCEYSNTKILEYVEGNKEFFNEIFNNVKKYSPDIYEKIKKEGLNIGFILELEPVSSWYLSGYYNEMIFCDIKLEHIYENKKHDPHLLTRSFIHGYSLIEFDREIRKQNFHKMESYKTYTTELRYGINKEIISGYLIDRSANFFFRKMLAVYNELKYELESKNGMLAHTEIKGMVSKATEIVFKHNPKRKESFFMFNLDELSIYLDLFDKLIELEQDNVDQYIKYIKKIKEKITKFNLK